ncbi:MAG: inositol monophosphatase [Clostridia bacterium]|nr:inositol monophosphatase [Clostridia bacterium]
MPVINLKALINEICSLVKECGKVILNADRDKMAIDIKSGVADLVTEYDKNIQEQLAVGLKRILPEAKFIGEEGANDELTESGYAFVVDPIDGTTNFIKDYHMSAISVALLKGKSVVAGVVYNPYLDEIFYAIKGGGAFCNGKKISVSSKPLSNGLVLFGSVPYNKELFPETLEILSEYYYKALDIRRGGSAALDLCYVACGRAELYFELLVSPWDFAAGKLLVEEAGGVVTTFDGEQLSFDGKTSILAKNNVI